MINIFVGALILSIWCVTLFFGKSIGLSMLLFIVPLTYYMIYILEKNKKIENAKAKILLIPIILLTSTYFIFNNNFFNEMNMIVIPILLVFMIMGLFNEKIKLRFDLIGKIFGMFLLPISFMGETLKKLRNCLKEQFKINLDSSKEERIKKVVKAICITIPIVLVIIILLSSADEIFGNIFVNIFKQILNAFSNIQISTIVIRIILTVCIFIYMLCFFDYILSRYEKDEQNEEEKGKTNDNFTIKMILTTLNIIYLVFCYIQVKSLFMRNVEIDYSHYARQGFFQLMIVSFINLVTILIAKRSENKNKYVNIMSLIMIGFTFIILISSAVRMYFYESAYGYTLLRLLVYCVLFTEAVLFIPTILYIKDKKINLTKAYFVIILIMYVCINFANFDNIIAKRNVDRYIETGKIDMYYLKSETGTDAVNQIIRILETNTEENEVKAEAKEYLKNIYDELSKKSFDIRECNISKIFAKTLIEKEVYIKNKTTETFQVIDQPEIIKSENHIKSVPYLNQKELGYPTGCEAVSATMLLKYKGYDVSVEDIVENTENGSKKYQAEDGTWYGANPFTEFVGHPSLGLSKGSYGVFAEPIANSMEIYAGEKVKNISGCTEEELFACVSKGEPIVVWCVKNAGDLKQGVVWRYEDGSGTFQELVGQHCAVLIGYDEEFVYLNDPSAGENVKQDKEKFIYNWKQLYSQAILVE